MRDVRSLYEDDVKWVDIEPRLKPFTISASAFKDPNVDDWPEAIVVERIMKNTKGETWVVSLAEYRLGTFYPNDLQLGRTDG